MGLFSPRRQTVYGNDLFVTPLPIRYCRRLQQGKNEERLAVFTTSLSGAGNQIRTDDLVITNDVLYQLSYTSIPADLHSIPHNDVFVKWFCKNILRSSKQVLIAEIFKFTDGCRGCSAVLTPRKPFGFCQGLSRFAIHVYNACFDGYPNRRMTSAIDCVASYIASAFSFCSLVYIIPSFPPVQDFVRRAIYILGLFCLFQPMIGV